MTVTGSTLSNNFANQGGGIYNSGSLTITGGATLSGNSALNVGGGIYNSGSLTITGSTLSNNQATSVGGGIFHTGVGPVALTNSTLSGNCTTQTGGGIYNNGTGMTFINSTLSGNRATTEFGGGFGGGISNEGSLNARNTLIAGNTAAVSRPDVEGAITSRGYNLIGNNSGATITPTTGDQIGTAAAPINPLLAPLANYGGPTQTHALLPGSPALNAGTNCVLTNNCADYNLGFNLTTDQRGTGFNRQVGSAVDIGAFESRGFTLAIASGNNQSTNVNTAFANPLAVTVTPVGAGEPTSGGKVTFTPPGSGASATIAGNPATISGITATGGTMTANATGGAYNVTASTAGAAAVNFALTNIVPNTPPTISDITNRTINEDSNTGAIAFTVGDGQTPAANLLLAGSSSNLTLVTNANIVLGGSGANRTVTVTPAPNQAGTTTITLTVTDSGALTASDSFLLTVNNPNSAPSITALNATRQQGNPPINLQIATVLDAEDAENNLTVTINGAASATTNGVTLNNLTINAAGQVRADLAVTCTATNASFTLTVTDTAGATANANLLLTVPANTAPAVGNYPSTTVLPGATLTITPDVAPSDNNSVSSLTAVAVPAGFTGSFAGNTSTGGLTITAANPPGTYTITVTLTDNCNATTTRQFTLTVNSCGATLSKSSESFAANGGSDSFTLTINAGCPWTAVSNNPNWLTVVSPNGTNTGSGTVTYAFAANPSNSARRSGTLTVAGQTFTVWQGPQFLDMPTDHPFYNLIGKLAARGVTLGCGGGNYCPGSNVTREQMAAFLIRALHEPGYVPPAPGAQRFLDVPSSKPFYGHIEEMALRAITLGCGGGNYCPTANVTRGQMAAFLVRAFNL